MLKNKRFYCFGEFRLDTLNCLLYCGEDLVSLRPKEFELLLALVERVGEVVKKDELLDKIWADTFVEEGTLTRNVSWLRKKLETASPGGDKFIETIPKRGYRFLPAVTCVSDFADDSAQEKIFEQTKFTQTAAKPSGEFSTGAINANKPNGQNPALDSEETNRRARPSSKMLRWAIFFGISAILALTVLAFYQIYFRRTDSKVPGAARVKPFSGAPGLENTPAFSPDGKQIAFAWDGDGGSYDIYVRLLSGGEPVRLTNTSESERYPVFSPDGSHIAFVRTLKSGAEVVLIPALGGTQQRVTHLFSGFASISFSPDGKTLAVIDTPDSSSGQPYAVYLIDLPTGKRRPLNTPGDFLGETTPRFSPDGKSIAFVRVFGDKNHDLFVVSADGGIPRRLTFDNKVIHSLAWSPDGKDILYTSYRDSDQPNIWRVSIDASPNGAPELVMMGGAESITNLAIAPDGKQIAYVSNKYNLDILRAGNDQSAEKKFAALTYNESGPTFSSDGGRVAFVSDRTGKNEIWTADAEGKNLRQITDTETSLGAPQFSPDNSKIAYYARTENGSGIFIVSSEGGANPFKLIEHGSENREPVWSPSGEYIYFTSNRTGEMNIWKIPASGGEAVQITHRGASKVVAATPDDKTLFFTKPDDAAIYRLIVGGEERILPPLADANSLKTHAATGQGIYFLLSAPGEAFKIKFYDFRSNQVRVIADKTSFADIRGNIAISPDGNVFLYTRQSQNISSIMIFESRN